MVKDVINGFILVEIGHFDSKMSFLVKIVKFGDQYDVIGQNFVVGRKYFFLKTVSKMISVRFINITFVKSIIYGVNLVKIGHFL